MTRTTPRQIQVASIALAICSVALIAVALIHLWISPLLYAWFGRSVRNALPVSAHRFCSITSSSGYCSLRSGSTR